MKSKGGDWTYADLYEFLTKPSAYVPGTKMTYPGEPDPQKRADIEAYLQQDSDAHPAFPK
jgi:cytochrome c